MKSSLAPTPFPGTYEDERGIEPITWLAAAAGSGFLLSTTIRGVAFDGVQFDVLCPLDPTLAATQGFVARELTDCVLGGDLPCLIERDGMRGVGSIRFRLALSPGIDSNILTLSIETPASTIEAIDDWFEDGVLTLERRMHPGASLICCATCQWSDYSPAGHGLIGMSCHRDAKERYLAVRSKADYWQTPVTEEVMETHHCEQFARRVPGTGYRG